MKFNQKLLDIDLKKKQFYELKSEKETNKEIGISRATRWRISKGKEMTMATFLKCLEWLNQEPNRYFER